MTLQDLGNCWSWNRSNIWCNVSWIISCDTNSLVYWTLDRMALIVYFLHQVWNVLVFLWLQDRNSSPLLCPLAVLCFVPLIKSYLTSGTVYIIMIKYIYITMFKWSKESSIHTQMQSKELLFDIYIYSFNVSTMFYLSFPSAVLSTCLILCLL